MKPELIIGSISRKIQPNIYLPIIHHKVKDDYHAQNNHDYHDYYTFTSSVDIAMNYLMSHPKCAHKILILHIRDGVLSIF